jgi:hypothetical protein
MLLKKRKLLTDREHLGRWGEKQCEKFLKRKGLKTLTRNFSCKTGELDLVMVDTDSTIVFVEVRTKADSDFPRKPGCSEPPAIFSQQIISTTALIASILLRLYSTKTPAPK